MSYFRLCPGCGAHSPPERLRCVCGASLAGVDWSPAETPLPEPADSHRIAPSASATGPEPVCCPFDDCAQPNPPGTVLCLYCNRPLHAEPSQSGAAAVPTEGVLSLPNALRAHWRIVQQWPARGAEAELLLVQALAGDDPPCVLKLYRHGIHPKADVQARVARIPERHRVRWLDSGVSDGFAYELMEYCPAGSLRQRLEAGPLPSAQVLALIASLAAALQAVHAQRLIHRDLKPENLLLRCLDPLDVVLTDFGIASVQDATLRFTSSARTLAYGAPESLAGVLDTKADYWAMGMIVLEAVQGEHPFAGLSEAVVLHRLSTRTIDLGRVRDARLRMLLRGLLLRDPQVRWGEAEVARWLAGDPTLAEPVEQGGALGARQPYRLGDDECFTADQLAVSLARHWHLAVADLDSGQLMRWLRQELADYNSVRVLITLNEQTHLSTDVRLLRLLLHLAPGLPPVWRGHALSLGTVLGWAAQTLKGDVDCARWLLDIHQQGVVRAYAEAGHAELADLHQRWQRAVDAFEADWQAAQAMLAHHHTRSEPASYDDVLYGQVSGSMRRPTPELLHARLLALSFDEAWTQRLRQHLAPELQRLSVLVPWLRDMGEAHQCRPPRLLVLHALLPEAQRWASAAVQRQEETSQQQRSDVAQLQRDNQTLWQDMRLAAHHLVYFDRGSVEYLAETLRAYDAQVLQVRRLGWSDEGLQRLRQRLTRQDMTLRPLREACHAWLEHATANQGWFSSQMGVAAFVGLVVVSGWAGGTGALLWLIAAAGVAVWRLQPLWRLTKTMRQSADTLPT
jgi:Protein kinase domain